MSKVAIVAQSQQPSHALEKARHRQSGGRWLFTSSTVLRARRLARLESSFDADPELAALTADLIEEVAVLRQRLRQLEQGVDLP